VIHWQLQVDICAFPCAQEKVDCRLTKWFCCGTGGRGLRHMHAPVQQGCTHSWPVGHNCSGPAAWPPFVANFGCMLCVDPCWYTIRRWWDCCFTKVALLQDAARRAASRLQWQQKHCPSQPDSLHHALLFALYCSIPNDFAC
jgi:hypothetical protein